MVIAFYEVREEWEKERLRNELPRHTLVFEAQPLVPETADRAREAEAVSVFIRSRVDRAVLDRLPRLRFLATRSTGFDHIDLAACDERGISVSNVPHYGENTVAEHTFGLILALSRRILQANRRTRAGDFTLDGLEGVDLRGKLLGVIGAGSIGLHVIRIARAFGMHVVAYDIARPAPHRRGARVPLRVADRPARRGRGPLAARPAHAGDAAPDEPRALRCAAPRRAVREHGARARSWTPRRCCGRWTRASSRAPGWTCWKARSSSGRSSSMFRTADSESRLRQVVAGSRLLERDDVIVTPHMRVVQPRGTAAHPRHDGGEPPGVHHGAAAEPARRVGAHRCREARYAPDSSWRSLETSACASTTDGSRWSASK